MTDLVGRWQVVSRLRRRRRKWTCAESQVASGAIQLPSERHWIFPTFQNRHAFLWIPLQPPHGPLKQAWLIQTSLHLSQPFKPTTVELSLSYAVQHLATDTDTFFFSPHVWTFCPHIGFWCSHCRGCTTNLTVIQNCIINHTWAAQIITNKPKSQFEWLLSTDYKDRSGVQESCPPLGSGGTFSSSGFP